MKATKTTAGVKLVLEMTEEEAKLLLNIARLNVTIPRALAKADDIEKEEQIKTLLNTLGDALEW